LSGKPTADKPLIILSKNIKIEFFLFFHNDLIISNLA